MVKCTRCKRTVSKKQYDSVYVEPNTYSYMKGNVTVDNQTLTHRKSPCCGKMMNSLEFSKGGF